MLDEDTIKKILSAQNEITEHLIYRRLARAVKDKQNNRLSDTIDRRP